MSETTRRACDAVSDPELVKLPRSASICAFGSMRTRRAQVPHHGLVRSQEPVPAGAAHAGLGWFPPPGEIHVPGPLVHVISAVHRRAALPRRSPGPAIPTGWATPRRRRISSRNVAGKAAMVGRAALLGGAALEDNQAVIVSEVCGRLHSGETISVRFIDRTIYRLHGTPPRPAWREVRVRRTRASSCGVIGPVLRERPGDLSIRRQCPDASVEPPRTAGSGPATLTMLAHLPATAL